VPGLEGVQVVFAGLGFEVGGFAGEVAAGGVDGLAGLVEDAGDRVLGEPVDLYAGVVAAQGVDGGEVAADVAQADG
jgi:hypothetical protein